MYATHVIGNLIIELHLIVIREGKLYAENRLALALHVKGNLFQKNHSQNIKNTIVRIGDW